MTPRKQKNGRVVPSPEPLRVANPHAAGIDVHASVHWVAVPSDHVPASKSADADAAANLPPHVRKFGGTRPANHVLDQSDTFVYDGRGKLP
jgi:hypothetical protein